MPNKIRVLLIEDNRLLREGITDILRTHGKFVVEARADGEGSTGQLADVTIPPEVVLLDLGLEKEHSLELMGVLLERFPQARVIAMDILPDQSDLVEFVKAGGAGFILKNAPLNDYVSTIKAVAGGATVLPTMLTESLFTQIVESVLKSGKGVPDYATRLTKRELEVVDLISEGMSNKEIAQQLHIATFTVKSHVHNALEKLDLSTRFEIAALVRDERDE